MIEYENMLLYENGVVDTERWKPIKRKENLTAYQDRCALAVSIKASNSITKPMSIESSDNPVSPFHSAFSASSTKGLAERVLWHGTINCDLDDLMLGVTNQSADMWKIKSSYIEDNGLDYFRLSSITERTVDKPFDGLQVKWTVNDMGPVMAKSLMRPRDFVFLESTGITYSPATGERMGYYICQSMDFPGARELPEHKLVRGKMELYHIFRLKSKGVVEVYVRARYDLRGDMPCTSVSLFSAEAMSALSLTASFAERRKVMWLLYRLEACGSDEPSFDLCSVCMKDLSKSLLPFMNKTCRICSGRICPRCRIPKKLSFLSRRTRGVVKKSIDICTRCVHTCAHTSAVTVAQGELLLENPTSILYESAATQNISYISLLSEG
uniref:FYVE-type domain-containing protein n=1 Tax=Hyaloperonospora arabidopsidis (strain Emoy2) TaxID=559515 RepID=M4BSG6_HYAAE